jgi:single-strand DNA-binding protein
LGDYKLLILKKVMFINRGIPGSGKSTMSQNIANLYGKTVICAGDDYFTDKVSSEKKTVTDWHSVTSWGEQAKEIYKQLKKGQQIYLEAKLKMRTWQSKEGLTHKGYELFLDTYILINANNTNPKVENHYPQVGMPTTPAPLPGFELSDLDELPF